MDEMPMPHMPPMAMYFHQNTHDVILFKGWGPSSTGAYVGALVAIFALCVLKEWVFSLRKRLAVSTEVKTAWIESGLVSPLTGGANADSDEEQQLHQQRSGSAQPHWVSAMLYMLNLTLGYMIMLIVMTYNIGYGVTVILGSGLGHFLFGGEPGPGTVEQDCCEGAD